jgi:hypothetical protein
MRAHSANAGIYLPKTCMNTAPDATPKYRTRSGRISEEIIDAATRIHFRTRRGGGRRRWDGGTRVTPAA